MQPEDGMVVAPAFQGQSGMTRAEIVAFFDRRQDLYDNLDAAALAAGYADDAIVESPLAGTQAGRAAVEQTFRGLFGAFLDLKTRTETLLIDGDCVAQVITIEGTQIGEFLGVPPSRKPFRLVAALLYELEARKIVRERRIYDFTGLLVQIGLLKAKPV